MLEGFCKMTQDAKWLLRYNEMKSFIEKNHRNPLKYAPKEKMLIHFLKRGRKLMNLDELKEQRLGMFKELIELGDSNRHINQYK